MRRDRDDDGDDVNGKTTPASLIQHPSTHFVPYTGRQYVHLMHRNCKGPGFNMRLMLHSNGLCVVALDPTNILVESYRNVFRSLSAEAQAAVQQAQRAFHHSSASSDPSTTTAASASVPLVADLADFCGAFPRRPSSSTSTTTTTTASICCDKPPPAGTIQCGSAADFYALVQRGEAALLPTGVSHTVKGTRGAQNRFESTAKVTGKHKRNAQYVQEDMTVCSFAVDTLVRCPQCRKWQVVQQAEPINSEGFQPRKKQVASETTTTTTTATSVEQTPQQPQPGGGGRPTIPPGCALAAPVADSTKHYLPSRMVKVPIAVNSVLLDVNQLVSDCFQSALSDPLGTGFIGVVQPRNEVSFTGQNSKFERVANVSPFVSPSAASRMFVPDAFTGAGVAEEAV